MADVNETSVQSLVDMGFGESDRCRQALGATKVRASLARALRRCS